jgi:hypothetical protein
MSLDDFLADGKADARARVLLSCMEPLKNHKDALGILGIDANAVVLHCESPHGAHPLAPDVNFRGSLTVVLDRVAD